jgi:hypothetical protein
VALLLLPCQRHKASAASASRFLCRSTETRALSLDHDRSFPSRGSAHRPILVAWYCWGRTAYEQVLTMVAGDKVATGIPLPGRPVGMLGPMTEVGMCFVMVEFHAGRGSYYRLNQLERTQEGS